MPRSIESKGARRILTGLLGALGILLIHGPRAEELVIPLELPQPNFIGFGVGPYPDYLGSSDFRVGAAPIGRFSLGGSRFVRLMASEIRINLLDDPRRFPLQRPPSLRATERRARRARVGRGAPPSESPMAPRRRGDLFAAPGRRRGQPARLG